MAQAAAAMPFDIPAQPLQAALEQFMKVTAHSGLYDSALTSGRYSAEVKGVMEPEAALRRLVVASGLNVHYDAGETFSITAGPVPQQVADPAPRGPYWNEEQNKVRYFGVLQARVREVFCRYPVTAPGGYRVALSLWIDSSGEIEQVRLLDSSGAADRDALIISGLRGRRLPLPPPAGIQQPITMLVAPAPSDAAGECIGMDSKHE